MRIVNDNEWIKAENNYFNQSRKLKINQIRRSRESTKREHLLDCALLFCYTKCVTLFFLGGECESEGNG